MKKIEYQTPEVKVVNIQLSKLICGSGSEAPGGGGLDD